MLTCAARGLLSDGQIQAALAVHDCKREADPREFEWNSIQFHQHSRRPSGRLWPIRIPAQSQRQRGALTKASRRRTKRMQRKPTRRRPMATCPRFWRRCSSSQVSPLAINLHCQMAGAGLPRNFDNRCRLRRSVTLSGHAAQRTIPIGWRRHPTWPRRRTEQKSRFTRRSPPRRGPFRPTRGTRRLPRHPLDAQSDHQRTSPDSRVAPLRIAPTTATAADAPACRRAGPAPHQASADPCKATRHPVREIGPQFVTD